MANTLTAFNPEYWSKRMQIRRQVTPVYKAVANMEERAMLKDGDVVHRPYRSDLRVKTYTKGTAITITDIGSTDESLSVDTAKVAPFYVDDIDGIQNKWDTVNKFADDAGDRLEEFIDADFLGEIVNADSSVDDGDIGGTAGTALVLSTSNVLKVFAAAGKKLDNLRVKQDNRYAVITPTVRQILVEYTAGRDTSLGDSTQANGMIGKFMGFDLYLSVNTYFTATWTPADNPTEADTVTINGVVFTFNATPSGAGSINIGANTAASIDNLVACINSTGTAGTDYIALSDASLATLEGCVATDGTTKMTIAYEGGGECVVAASETADPWSLEVAHMMFGRKGAVDIVIQKEPQVVFKDVPDKLGKNVLPWTLYGLKTFDEGDAELVDVQLDSSGW
jgi:hypothetical protein